MERENTRKDFNKIQKRFIKNNPICCRCGGPANEAHHITPVVYGGGNEESNLAPLCSACHKELDVWEAAWVHKMGACSFEQFFAIFENALKNKILYLHFGKHAQLLLFPLQ